MTRSWAGHIKSLIEDAQREGVFFYVSRECDSGGCCLSFRCSENPQEEGLILWKIEKEF